MTKIKCPILYYVQLYILVTITWHLYLVIMTLSEGHSNSEGRSAASKDSIEE